MAIHITITDQPKEVAPVYNPLWFNVFCNNASQPNFKYTFDIYTGLVPSGNPLATIKLLPRPSTFNCIFSPARVLESVLSYDSSSFGSRNTGVQNITSAVTSYNHVTDYFIQMGAEFTSGNTLVSFTGLTHSTGYTFNGVLEYDEVPYWNPNTGSIFALTHQPNNGVADTVLVKNASDRGTLSFFDYGATARYMFVDVIHNDGTDTLTMIDYTGWSASAPDNRVIHVPSGPWNLNNIDASMIISGATAGAIVDVDNDLYYTVFMLDYSGFTSESKAYVIDTSCNKYQTVRVQFFNRLGGFDYFNFCLVSRKQINIKRNSYKQNLAYNYSVGDKEKTTTDIDGNFIYMLNSDWITDSDAIWLEELLTSTDINIIDENGFATPVTMVDESKEVQKKINDKLFNISFSLESSASILGQRA